MTAPLLRVLRFRPSSSWLVGWAALTGFYLLLVWKTQTAEIVAGGVCGALAASAWLAVWMEPGEGFRFRLGWLWPLARILGRVVTDSALIARCLLSALVGRSSRGRFLDVPFDPGGEDREAAARQALVLAGISLPPNSYALAVDRDKACVRVHQLVRTKRPGGGDRSWPL